MPEIRIVGLGGSRAQRSASRAALNIALKGAEEAGARVEMFDVRKLNLPLYEPDTSDAPEAARRLADSVAGARGLLWSSPLYHGTVSGAFKNALDWLQLLSDRDPPFLTNKVVGLISTAGGVYGLQAVNTMWNSSCGRCAAGVSRSSSLFPVHGKCSTRKARPMMKASSTSSARWARRSAVLHGSSRSKAFATTPRERLRRRKSRTRSRRPREKDRRGDYAA